MADGRWRGEAAIEVYSFDDCVDGHNLDLVSNRLDDSGIVADADEQPGRRWRQPRLDAADELLLGEFRNGHFA
jgi:hypothetical protein